jgi:RNA 2',3'-cyclic 3'-phosphodiesterase
MPELRRRLFFALWPDDTARAAIVERTAAQVKAAGGRRVPPANLHVTVAFLGSITEPVRMCLEAGAGALRAHVFELALERVAHWRGSRVLCLEATQTPPALLALVDAVAEVQRACGLRPEQRPYRAHLTLARDARAPRGPAPAIEAIAWPVQALHLIESITAPAGARYERLQSWPLEHAYPAA